MAIAADAIIGDAARTPAFTIILRAFSQCLAHDG
jgi:hypothetical protein